MNRSLDPNLYVDLQTLPPGDFCPVCGGERYRPGLRCLRCEGGMA